MTTNEAKPNPVNRERRHFKSQDTAVFDHFLEAQDRVYDRVLQELRAGYKQSHWMWFIFPQLGGLGSSALATRFAIRDLDHARLYAEHEILGPRLRECVALVSAHDGRSARTIFGSPDDLKFRSSMTLFLLATEEDIFRRALDQFCEGQLDPLTTGKLGG